MPLLHSFLVLRGFFEDVDDLLALLGVLELAGRLAQGTALVGGEVLVRRLLLEVLAAHLRSLFGLDLRIAVTVLGRDRFRDELLVV